MAERDASVKQRVTIVNYDLTSSDEDPHSDIESADGQAFVYASSELPAPCWEEAVPSMPSTADSEIARGPSVTNRAGEVTNNPNIAARVSNRSPQPALESLTGKSYGLLADGIPIQLSDSSDSDECERTMPAGVPSPKRIKAEPPVVEIANSCSLPSVCASSGWQEAGSWTRRHADSEIEQGGREGTDTPELVEVVSSGSLSSSDDKECDINPEGPRPKIKRPYSLNMAEVPTQLRHFLAKTKRFYTKNHSLERVGPCIAASTYAKAEERMLCFLGHAKKARPVTELSPRLFADSGLIEDYLDYLRDARTLSPATISNHVSSLLYPLKFMYRHLAPRFEGAPIIVQLRRTATLLQKQGDVDRPKTREELQALNRWLDWDEVLDALELQRSRFEVARTSKHRAREAADLLLLSLYVHIPPSRGLEIRTLEIVYEEELASTFSPAEFRNRNVALLKRCGAVTIHVQSYKTSRFMGHDQIELRVETELCRLLRRYVEEFRPDLCSPETRGSTLFLNANGQPFTSGAFSRHIRGLMMRLTGRAVSINCLRSAFITWAYSQSDCTDQMKDSLAAALRHSREQAQSTYDRRTANQKKELALGLAQRTAEQGGSGSAEQESQAPSGDGQAPHKLGDFVGLVEEDSTLQEPKILLGRIHAFLPEEQALLLWYKSMGAGVYCLQADGTQWVESLSALVPVSVKPAKGKPNGYRLTASLRTIHKAVHGSRQG